MNAVLQKKKKAKNRAIINRAQSNYSERKDIEKDLGNYN